MKYRTMKRKLERKRKRNSAKSNQCNKIRRKRIALQFSPTLSESSFKPSSVPKISLSIQQEKTMKNAIDLPKKVKMKINLILQIFVLYVIGSLKALKIFNGLEQLNLLKIEKN